MLRPHDTANALDTPQNTTPNGTNTSSSAFPTHIRAQGWICQSVVVFGFPYTPENVWKVPVLTVILTLLPWSPLAKACGAQREGGRQAAPGLLCAGAIACTNRQAPGWLPVWC